MSHFRMNRKFPLDMKFSCIYNHRFMEKTIKEFRDKLVVIYYTPQIFSESTKNDLAQFKEEFKEVTSEVNFLLISLDSKYVAFEARGKMKAKKLKNVFFCSDLDFEIGRKFGFVAPDSLNKWVKI